MDMLMRIGKYLKAKPRLVWKFCWQAPLSTIDITSDANWAGCKRVRKSELYAAVRASAEGLGIATLLTDFGVKDPKVSIGMDANAAIGMVQRTGLNKVRHVEVDVLWIQ